MIKVKVTIDGNTFVTYKSCVSHNSKTDKGNVIKFHRKVKQNGKVCRANKICFPRPRSRSRLKVIGLSLTNRVSVVTQKPVKGI